MKLPAKPFYDVLLATLLSMVFCGLLAQQIMAGGLGTSISLLEFIQAPENVLTCLLMSAFVFASWLMKGVNNRTVLVFWAVLLTFNYWLFWQIYELFSGELKNIYMLNLAGVACSLPVVLGVTYRVRFTYWLLPKLQKVGLCKHHINRYLAQVQTTDFDHNMQVILSFAFGVEVVYAAYILIHGVIFDIPIDGSFFELFAQKQYWHPYNMYIWLLNIIGCVYILTIGFYLIKDRKQPDAFGDDLNIEQRRVISRRILDKYRQEGGKKQNKK